MSQTALAGLEHAISQALALVESLSAENADLKKEIRQLKKDLEELRQENQAKQEQIERFESDRLEIRARVDGLIRSLMELDGAGGSRL